MNKVVSIWNIRINNDSFIQQINVLDCNLRNIMYQFVLISIIISFTLACQLKQLICEDLIDKISCDSVESHVAKCNWNQKTNQCQSQNTNLNQHQNYGQYNECGWYQKCDQKKLMQVIKTFNQSEEEIQRCDSIDSFQQCISFNNNGIGCTWKHNKCYQISQCSEINDFMQCRISRIKEKCQLVINGKSSRDLFDEYECRAKDCKFNLFSQCQNFVNGRRCFQYYGECSQCSYFTTLQSCSDTNQCTWQNDVCRNILCSDLKGKNHCESKPFCLFNQSNLQCETRTDNQLYCYAYDIPSDPIKSKKKVEI
ncbi:unnamed protein product (macronuclear) [Paramecium tetraurelia]|uniref:Transmembrane protein n=1 Tax=Paramecium tetraurelia TaxID=5888 RepID=A0CAI7_PARTE|nr:uncharacterized protein GSPATT00036584001 [Paramecium tetraurelia]CAK67804.1 unnamed protein product [Paramecium tetraurelia]|eukprot:XP_001435201.1 hypothetical protein (macronuclear) [Paramecium tetraurelia strain d4-2]